MVCDLGNTEARAKILREYVDKWLEDDPLAASESLRDIAETNDSKMVAEGMVNYLERRVGSEALLEEWRKHLNQINQKR